MNLISNSHTYILLFSLGKRGRWFDELTKILHYHLKDLGTAESVCAEALDSVNEPFVLTGFKRTIELRQRRIKKLQTPPRPPPSLKGIVDSIITIHAVKVFSETGKKALYVRNIEDAVEPKPVTVEQLAINYFQDEMLVNNGNSSDSESGKGRWRAVHSENSALPTLFALLFFDIMFLDTIPGVFISPFQTRPLDLSSEFFYISRRAQIEERLAEIRGVDKGDDGEVFIESMIRRVDENERKRRTLCVGLNWDLFSMDDLIEICKVNSSQRYTGY